MNKLLSALLIILQLFTPLFGYSETNPSPEIKIGVIIPLSGALAANGAAFREAALMGLEDAASEQKLKLSYKLIFEDDQLKSKNALLAANKLVNQDKVNALISTWSYGGSVVSPLAEQSKTLHLSVAWVREISKGAYNFLHLAPPKKIIPAIFDVLEQRGLKKIATFAMSEAGAVYALDEIDRLAPLKGFTVVSRNLVESDANDFKSIILREMGKKPDVIYVNLVGGQFDLFISQLRNLGFKTPVIAQTALSTVESRTPYNGYWFISDSYFPDAKLEERLTKRVNHKNTLYAANFYDAVRALISAHEKNFTVTHSDRVSFNPNLSITPENIFSDFHSIYPELEIDSDGVFNYGVKYFQIINGEQVGSSKELVLGSKWGK